MRLRVHLLGRELLAVDTGPPQDEPPRPQAEPVQAAPQPEIPAGFGFHGGSGGSHQMGWHKVTDRPAVIDHDKDHHHG